MVLDQMRAPHRRLGGKVRIELFAGEASGRSVQSGVGQCELRLQSDLLRRQAEDRFGDDEDVCEIEVSDAHSARRSSARRFCSMASRKRLWNALSARR
jgi:hypothetical protein